MKDLVRLANRDACREPMVNLKNNGEEGWELMGENINKKKKTKALVLWSFIYTE